MSWNPMCCWWKRSKKLENLKIEINLLLLRKLWWILFFNWMWNLFFYVFILIIFQFEKKKKMKNEKSNFFSFLNNWKQKNTQIKTGDVKKQLIPSDNKHVLATFHQANSSVLQQAVDAALAAKAKWEEMPFDDRAAIFLKV